MSHTDLSASHYHFSKYLNSSIDKVASLFWETAGINMFDLESKGCGLETVLVKFHVDESEEIEWCSFVMHICAGL